MGIIPDRSKRSGVALFLRVDFTGYDVRMYDQNEGIQLANEFISYLEIFNALGQLPPKYQAVMIMYFGSEMTQEQVAEKVGMPVRTIGRWIREGLNQMAEIIWD